VAVIPVDKSNVPTGASLFVARAPVDPSSASEALTGVTTAYDYDGFFNLISDPSTSGSCINGNHLHRATTTCRYGMGQPGITLTVTFS
jgi:hypothetical protein